MIVRLKSGIEGLSRCRIASTAHMFSMGATDILDEVASLIGLRTGDTKERCYCIDASIQVDDGGSVGVLVMGL